MLDALVGIPQEKLQIMVEDYVMDLKKRVNPNSVPTFLYGVQAFFDSNDIDLRWKKIRRLYPAKIKITGEKPYTTKQIQLMLSYTTSLRNKAVIHLMAASGEGSEILVTKASAAPPKVGWIGLTVGKLGDSVRPVT